jgi:hypothetical protein
MDKNSLEYYQSKENYNDWKRLLTKEGLVKMFPKLKGKWKQDEDEWSLIMFSRYNERECARDFDKILNESLDLYPFNERKLEGFHDGILTISDKELAEVMRTHPMAKKVEGLKHHIVKPTDPIVESVIGEFRERSEVGIKKYGTTLAENNTDDFLRHLKEELMDAVLYIKKLQREVKSD